MSDKKHKPKATVHTRLARRLGRSVFFVSAAVLGVVMLILYIIFCVIIYSNTSRENQTDVESTAALITSYLDRAETILGNEPNPVSEGNAHSTVRHIVLKNHNIAGSAVALTRDQARKCHGKDYYMVYAWQDSDSSDIQVKNIGDSEHYDYHNMEWFKVPIETGQTYWSEPYYDEGGGDMLMCTYSHPFSDHQGNVIGVMTVDVSLDEGIKGIVEEMSQLIDDDYNTNTFLLSRNGQLLAGDTIGVSDRILFQSPVQGTDWTLFRALDRHDIAKERLFILLNIVLVYIFSVIAIFLSNMFTLRKLARPEVQNQMRLMTELDMASKIQQGMLPKSNVKTNTNTSSSSSFSSSSSSSVPSITTESVRALMRPAKEIGGDFYNYFEDNGLLYFIIADVSGKGMPAAMIMALTTQLFLVVSPGQKDPSMIVQRINNQLCRDNESSMFVTMIVGILNAESGELQLCNAGHNPPLIVDRKEHTLETLQLPANCPVGLFEDFPYQTTELTLPKGKTLLLYTDGVTEAENSSKEQFGMQRLIQAAKTNADIHSIEEAVDAFAGASEQSDDITLMSISL